MRRLGRANLRVRRAERYLKRRLKAVGKRHPQREEINADGGRVRVVYRTPNWEDYVHVACTEIRACGASSVQIARRMRAMLDNLCASLPKHRRVALDEESANASTA
jgi:uncharacterized membrane protein